MAAGPEILVRFIGDASSLQKASSQVEGSGSKWKKFGAIAGTALAGIGLAAFAKGSVAAAEESAQATSRLQNVFRSMGDTTGEAAKQAENYANALSKRIGVDDEAIMGAQAMLATFGAVSNATARQAGIFDRTTAAAADLAAAGFGNLEGNAKLLGKALTDPVKYSNALARSGVVLTKSQKDQVKAFMASGQQLKAQQLILGAVEKRVGGTAAATATSSQKMAVAWDNVQESLGARLLPVVKIAVDMFARYGSVIVPVGIALLGVVVAMKAYQLATAAIEAATGLATAAQWLWNAAVAANPIMLIVIAIAAVIAIVILAYAKIDWFRAAVDAALNAVVASFKWLWNVVTSVFNWIRGHWPLLLAIIVGPIGIAALAVIRHWNSISGAARAVVNVVVSLWQWLAGGIGAVVGYIGSLMARISALFHGPADTVRWMVGFIENALSSLGSFLWRIVGGVGGAVSSIVNAIRGPINAVIGGLNALNFTIPRVHIPLPFGKSIDLGPWPIRLVPFNIPRLAEGGITRSAGLAFLHPAEVVAPLSQAQGMGTTNVYIDVSVPPTASPVQTGRAIVDAIRSYENVAGTGWRRAPGGRKTA